MKPLELVSDFGAIDADSDDLLLESFEDHEAFEAVTKRQRFLIIGRKGSGKTAIFKKLLTNTANDYFCLGHTFSDYPWHHHNLQARVGIPDFDRFTHSWKYLILLSASKIILNFDNSLPFDEASMDDAVRIERFVLDTYGTRDPDVTQIFSPTKRLKLKPYFELDWKLLKGGIKPESVPMDQLPIVVQELNTNLLRAVLHCLNPDHQYYIAFDQLDLGFDPTDPDYKNRLIGLLLACRDINIAARASEKALFVVTFLRDDIYDLLQFEDKNKITENFMSLIEWDTPRTRSTLKDLMEKRFTARLTDDGMSVKWESVFNETREMPGHQTKYQHMLDRTYLRPRDMIRLCNSVLQQYTARKHTTPDIESFLDNIDVNGGRVEYSNYLKNELDDEIHKHVPDYKEYLEMLRAVGTWHFERKQFEDQWTARKREDREGAEGALQELFTFSVVGYYRPGGRGYGGSEYVFRYKEPVSKFDPTATRFRVHPGLIDYLGLKRL